MTYICYIPVLLYLLHNCACVYIIWHYVSIELYNYYQNNYSYMHGMCALQPESMFLIGAVEFQPEVLQ